MLGLKVYHGAFSVRYDVALAANFADLSGVDTKRGSSRNLGLQGPFTKGTLFTWKSFEEEAISFVKTDNGGHFYEMRNYLKKLEPTFYSSLRTYYRKAKRKAFHFAENDSDLASAVTHEFPDILFGERYDCKKEKYLYMQVCQDCMQKSTTVCINQSKNGAQICMVLLILKKYCKCLNLKSEKFSSNFQKTSSSSCLPSALAALCRG